MRAGVDNQPNQAPYNAIKHIYSTGIGCGLWRREFVSEGIGWGLCISGGSGKPSLVLGIPPAARAEFIQVYLGLYSLTYTPLP